MLVASPAPRGAGALDEDPVATLDGLVRGIAHGGFGNAQAVFVNRGVLAGAMGEDDVAGFVSIHTDAPHQAPGHAAALASLLPEARVKTWREDNDYLRGAIEGNARIGAISMAMVLFAVTLPVWALLHVRVRSRRGEIAVLRALGFTRRDVFAGALLEGRVRGRGRRRARGRARRRAGRVLHREPDLRDRRLRRATAPRRGDPLDPGGGGLRRHAARRRRACDRRGAPGTPRDVTERAMTQVLEAFALSRRVGARREVTALRHAELRLRRGKVVAIVGRSGSGKSTLLSLLGLLDRPDAGALSLCGEDVTGAPDRVRAALRLARAPSLPPGAGRPQILPGSLGAPRRPGRHLALAALVTARLAGSGAATRSGLRAPRQSPSFPLQATSVPSPRSPRAHPSAAAPAQRHAATPHLLARSRARSRSRL
jgi:hypothetical protein